MNHVRVPYDVDAESLREIPGIKVRSGNVFYPPDCVEIVSEKLGIDLTSSMKFDPRPLAIDPETLPGWHRRRSWQETDSIALARGEKKWLVLPAGSGKSTLLLFGSKLYGAKKTLFVTTAKGIAPIVRDAKWATKQLVVPVRGFGPDFKIEAAYEVADVLVVNYEILHKRLSALSQCKFDLLICDESHKLGSWKYKKYALWTQAIEALSKIIAWEGKDVWLATATMIRDRRRELWRQCHVLFPDNRFGNSYAFSIRYCLHPTTPILTPQGYVPIRDLKVGDEVIGWSDDKYRTLQRAIVKNVFVRKARTVKVTTESGKEIICTADHKWFTGYPNAKYRYRSLAEGLERFRIAAHFPYKFVVRSPSRADRSLYRKERRDHFMSGYVAGAFAGDGHVAKKKDTRPEKYGAYNRKVVLRVRSREFAERVDRYLTLLGIDHRPMREKSGYFIVSSFKKESFRYFKLTRKTYVERSIKGTAGGDFIRGWLSGIYDAEGWLGTIAQYESVNPETYAVICRFLDFFNFKYTKDAKAVRLLGGRQELIRFFELTHPAITAKIDGVWKHGPKMPEQYDKIVKASVRDAEPVYSIETSTGNYVANGFASKNCDGYLNAYGGLVNEGRSNTEELQKRLAHYVVRRTKAEVMKELPARRREIVRIEPKSTDKKKRPPKGRERALEHAASQKVDDAVEIASDILHERGKVILITNRKRELGRIEAKVRAACKGVKNLEIFVVSGNIPVGSANEPKSRTAICNRYLALDDSACLIATMDSISESIDLQRTDAMIFLALPQSPGTLDQVEGRGVRLGQDRPIVFYYLVQEGSIDEVLEEMILRKLTDTEDLQTSTSEGVADSFRNVPDEAAIRQAMDAWLSKVKFESDED